MPVRVFLSYAAEDRIEAERLCSALEAAGVDVWWDQNIAGGARYPAEIERALNSTDLIVVCWSEASLKSDWVRDEAEFARDNGKLFPISLDGAQPPIGFWQYQVEPLPTKPTPEQVNALVTAICSRIETGEMSASTTVNTAPKTKKRRTFPAAMLAGLVAIAALVYMGINQFSPAPEPPLVMIMDSAHPARIYDEDVKSRGATNADILSDILADLPIRTQKELISPDWHRFESILQFDPDLIVIHYSGFKQEDGRGARPRLKLLVEYFESTDTEFLIYSRASNAWLQGKVDVMLGELFATNPELKARIEVFALNEYGEPYWLDQGPAQGIKLRIKDMLNLEQN